VGSTSLAPVAHETRKLKDGQMFGHRRMRDARMAGQRRNFADCASSLLQCGDCSTADWRLFKKIYLNQ
jgi:hypothetical protein